MRTLIPLVAALCTSAVAQRQASGVYPHLAMFNNHGECGVGAVVPFADRLWVMTYAPHEPRGSTDKLYEINGALRQIVRDESVGGTPANRLIHRETNQLVIGPYVVDARRRVRTIPYTKMVGRPTGTARHLTNPGLSVYTATMEEGFYSIDLSSLAVTELFADTHVKGERPRADLPGYHGKGLYSGQGVLVYANNGENSAVARRRPDVPSGCLAEWDGQTWRVVRRNQFTEVTGPGGIYGNTNPDTDPIWSIGWDHRSLILMVRDRGAWHPFRLPKGSHSYDGAHGWNTEWPRIREIGEGDDLLMTMHGTFWRFPAAFSSTTTGGIEPRSNYLKIVGDFCRWGDRIVLGCDDTAKNEFLNKRRAKGEIAGPGQSHSNLWFVEPRTLDELGPALGRGAVWLGDDVESDAVSDPFLFDGYEERGLHLAHDSDEDVQFELEVDRRGDGKWATLTSVAVVAHGHRWLGFDPGERGAWIRIRARQAARGVTAMFQYAAHDGRGVEPDAMFAGLAGTDDESVSGGLVRVRGAEMRKLAVAASVVDGDGVRSSGFYELDAELQLRRVDDEPARKWTADAVAIPDSALTIQPASVLYVDDDGNRWRLPRGDAAFDRDGPLGAGRLAREVVTERDLLSAHGTFYELPARNAGGFQKVRPIASHNLRVHDFCSYRGLLVMTGMKTNAPATEHVIVSDDGQAAVWVGVIDDLWKLGKPRGHGGPWLNTPVQAATPSDPYLMTGYDQKSFALSHDATTTVTIDIQVDATGTGTWHTWRSFKVPPGEQLEGAFPRDFHAYWLRTLADTDCRATATFTYR